MSGQWTNAFGDWRRTAKQEEKTMLTFSFRSPFARWAYRGLVMLLVAPAALLLPASAAVAEPVVVDTHVPFTFAADNLCTGEAVAGSAFLHEKLRMTTVPNFHFSLEANVESAQGITVSGVRYVMPAQEANHTIMDTDTEPANTTQEFMMQLIRQAEDGTFILGDDLYIRFKAHFTVNAMGDITVFFGDFIITCR